MCGRYALVLTTDGLQTWIANPDERLPEQLEREGRLIRVAEGGSDIVRRVVFESYNIAPTQTAPIITNRAGTRNIEIARWSLVPSWWRESSPPRFSTFNARDDKLNSGMWKNPVRRGRCLVPSVGFYEWTGPKGDRIPHFIHKRGRGLFAFAGLYDDWTNPETGEVLTSYTIITTEPNDLMRPIHNRMPVILPDDEAETLWLDPASDSLDSVSNLLKPTEWDGFKEYEVAPLRGDGPELVVPAHTDRHRPRLGAQEPDRCDTNTFPQPGQLEFSCR